MFVTKLKETLIASVWGHLRMRQWATFPNSSLIFFILNAFFFLPSDNQQTRAAQKTKIWCLDENWIVNEKVTHVEMAIDEEFSLHVRALVDHATELKQKFRHSRWHEWSLWPLLYWQKCRGREWQSRLRAADDGRRGKGGGALLLSLHFAKTKRTVQTCRFFDCTPPCDCYKWTKLFRLRVKSVLHSAWQKKNF